jgi:hypothetical protein
MMVFSFFAILSALLALNPLASRTGTEATRLTKSIEDIVAGDMVMARDPETGEYGPKRVLETFRRTSDHLRLLTIRSADGEEQELRTTDEHPFWTAETGWVSAGQLRPGQHVQQDDGAWATIVATVYEPHPEGITVYNFEVEGFHTYYVAEGPGVRSPPVLVHNRYRTGIGRRTGRFRRVFNTGRGLFRAKIGLGRTRAAPKKTVCRDPKGAKKPVLVGEGMDRVIAEAKKRGWGWYKPRRNAKTPLEVRNKRWVQRIKREGREVYDYGPRPEKSRPESMYFDELEWFGDYPLIPHGG